MRARTALLVPCIVVAVFSASSCERSNPEPDPSADVRAARDTPQSAAVDSSVPLAEALRRISECETGARADDARRDPEPSGRPPASSTGAPSSGRCPGVLYVWSPLMPLSRRGIGTIEEAADELGIALSVVRASALYERRPTDVTEEEDRNRAGGDAGTSPGPSAAAVDSLVGAMLAAGATVHYPATLVHREGRLVGEAILGYKTAGAYRHMVEERLETSPSELQGTDATTGSVRDGAPHPGETRAVAGRSDAALALDSASGPADVVREFPVAGSPGPYFRWVPGRDALAFEANSTIYLLDLRNGDLRVAPGHVDFIPTPDGRFFVTPGPDRSGLEFYDADEVFEAAEQGDGERVEPLFRDPEMRDQYPSVGILEPESEGAATVYRVFTSWFERGVFRDYEVRTGAGGAKVRPRGDPVVGCPDRQVSTPIMSKDGREVAGRDEATGTTKLFRLHDDGSCEELRDLGIQTGKVAFGPEARKVAFAVPPGAFFSHGGVAGADEAAAEMVEGIFVLDRDEELITRVQGSEAVDRLAFPDFVGRDSIAFLKSRSIREERSLFRLVCCVGGPGGGR